MSPVAIAKVMVFATADVRRWYQSRVTCVAMYDGSGNTIRLVAGLFRVSLPKGVLPKRVPQLGARDVVLVSLVVDVIVLNRDDRFSIVNHARDRRLRVHR